jgi:ATP-dependent DNA helicase RecQ
VYQLLANYYQLAVGSAELEAFDFDFDDFRSRYKLEVVPSYNALKKLEEEGYIHLNESFHTSSKAYIPISYEQLYEFQLKYPRLDPFIKALLRLYGGDLFTHFTIISESKLAKHMQIAVSELVSNLEILNKQGILQYQPTNSNPKLTFLTPRYDARNLPLNKRKMDDLKQRKVQKQEEMIHYAKTNFMCRMAFILEYFGEETNIKCGKCDNCLAKS